MKLRIRRNEPIRETQMVSLADIAFLLIFFFMLSSQFMRDRVAVELPGLPRADRTQSGTSVTLDQTGALWLDGQPVASPDLLQSRLETILAGRTTAKEREVRFKCARTLTHRQFRPVLEAISAAGGVISIMHDVIN